jgi:hypothetical protein
MLYLRLLNHRHSVQRVALGKPAKIVDLSMLGKDEVAKMDKRDMEHQLPDHLGESAILDDVTDVKNEDFVYVY